jgi:hypothetical protein
LCGGSYGAEDILAERDAVELEIGLEKEVGGVVESPFTGLVDWVTETYLSLCS